MLFSDNRKVPEVKDFGNSNSIMAIYQTLTTRADTGIRKTKKTALVLKEFIVEGRHISMTTQPDRARQEAPWELKE